MTIIRSTSGGGAAGADVLSGVYLILTGTTFTVPIYKCSVVIRRLQIQGTGRLIVKGRLAIT